MSLTYPCDACIAGDHAGHRGDEHAQTFTVVCRCGGQCARARSVLDGILDQLGLPMLSDTPADTVTVYDASGQELARRSIRCHCPEVDAAPPGVHRYCGVHDRASAYPGPILRGDGS